jgi:UDP-glucose 4-epimerase
MVLDRIGLTGATGMLGRHLHISLSNVGAEVVAVSRTALEGAAVWDLTQWLTQEELDELFLGVSAVVHAGALVKPSGEVKETRMFDANVRACLNLGQWALARGIPLVHISGAIVYADPMAEAQNEAAATGFSGLGGFYGLSKLLAEDVLLRLRQQGLKLAVLRPSSIYGQGQDEEKIVPRFLDCAAADHVIELIAPIEDRFDLVHAADVAAATIATLKHECWETLNVSSANPVSIEELAQACLEVAGRGRIAVKGHTPQTYQATVRYALDIGRASDLLGWEPVIDLRRGLNMLLHGQYHQTY